MAGNWLKMSDGLPGCATKDELLTSICLRCLYQESILSFQDLKKIFLFRRRKSGQVTFELNFVEW
jgi:hypothetical protein